MTILKWALIFFLVSIVAGILGFTGISAASADVARFLFYVFVVIFLVLLILGLRSSGCEARSRRTGLRADPIASSSCPAVCRASTSLLHQVSEDVDGRGEAWP